MPTDTLESVANQTSQGSGERKRRKNNRGNFANDPERAREAGRKGGRARGRTR